MDNTIKQYLSWQYWKGLLIELGHALRTKKFWKEFIVINFGIMIGAAAVYYFLMPSHLIIGTSFRGSRATRSLQDGDRAHVWPG